MLQSVATSNTTPESRIAALEAALAAEREMLAKVTHERDVLRAAHERLRTELELLRRRIFVAKAERVDTAQLELEFAHKLAELDQLSGTVKPTGRRDLRTAALEEERVEIHDPLLEELVQSGKAERIGYEENRAIDAQGESQIETAPMPRETFARSLAAPSLLAPAFTPVRSDFRGF